MALSFDFNANNKLYPFGSKSSNNDFNSVFVSTEKDVYIALYPNNSNDVDFDDFYNNIIFGVSNIGSVSNNYRESYISAKDIKIIRFNEQNIITNVDFEPYSYSNISLGNFNNRWNSTYIKDFINISNTYITSDDNKIYLDTATFNNLNINNLLQTKKLNISQNAITSNIYVLGTIIENASIINDDTIYTNHITTSNIKSYGNIITNNLYLDNLYSSNAIISNLTVFGNINISNVNVNNIYTDNVFSSNISNLSQISTQNLYVSDYYYKNNIIDANLLPNSNDFYNLGTNISKWCNIYISSSIYSDYNSIKNNNNNLITDNNLIVNNSYINGSIISSNIENIKNIYAHNGLIIGKNLNTNLLKTNNIISSNLLSLNDILSSNIKTIYLYTNDINVSNINVLYKIYSSNFDTQQTFNEDLETLSFISSNLHTSNIVINNNAYINNIKLYNDIHTIINNKNDIGSDTNRWSNLYNANIIYFDGISINSYVNENINVPNKLISYNKYTSNIIVYNDIETENIIGNNLTIISCNIDNTNLISTDYIYTSNIEIHGTLIAKDIEYVNDLSVIGTSYFSNIDVLYNAFASYLTANNIYSSNDVYSNLLIDNTITSKKFNIINLSHISNLNTSTHLIPSLDDIYSLGSYNKKWKDAYLSASSVYIGDKVFNTSNNDTINIYNNNYEYNNLIVQKIILDNANEEGTIFINNNGYLSFGSLSNSSLNYFNISNIPFNSNLNYISADSNYIFENIFNSNAIFYNNICINSISSDNTLYVDSNIIANKIYGLIYGDSSNLYDLDATKFINKLPSYSGGLNLQYVLSNLTYKNNNFILNDGYISKELLARRFYGDGYNISNISADNIIRNISVNKYGTGCESFGTYQILYGNNEKRILSTPYLKWNNNSSNLYINDTINIDNTLTVGNLTLIKDYPLIHRLYNASNITNIISSNIINILASDNGSIIDNVFDNIKLLNNNVFYIDDYYNSKELYGIYLGDGINISNIVHSNIIHINDINGGLNYNNIFGTSNILWDNVNNILTINDNIFANNLVGIFVGNATNLENVNVSTLSSTLPTNLGGTNAINLNPNELLYFNGDISSSQDLYWSNNILIVNGKIVNTDVQGLYIGDGYNISNINTYSINDIVLIQNGGLNNRYFNKYEMLYSDGDSIDSSFKIRWINNKLLVKGDIISEIIQSSKYYGDAYNVSNIIGSNIQNIISTQNGGTSLNSLGKNKLLYGGNRQNKILNDNDLYYLDDILHLINLQTNNINITTSLLSSNNILGCYYGDGCNISNLLMENIYTTVLDSVGGLGISNHNKYDIVLYPNIKYNYKELLVDNKLFIDKIITSNYYGNGYGISNIVASNLINILEPSNGGITNYINFYENLNWGDNKLLVKGNIITDLIKSSNFAGDGYGLSNIFASNLVGVLNKNTILSNIYFTKDYSWFDDKIIIYDTLYSKDIQSTYHGEGIGISNLIIDQGIVSIEQGGLGCNIIPKNRVLIGNDSYPILTSGLLWYDKQIQIEENAYIDRLYGKLFGSGINISNIVDSNIKGQITNGRLTNIISSDESANLSWNEKLRIIGNYYSDYLKSSEFKGDGNNVSNIIASNIINNVKIINGGFNNLSINISNIDWNKDTNNLYIHDDLISTFIQGNFIGDGINLSNINAQNIINDELLVSKGGLEKNYIPEYNILFGNEISENILWSNNTLYINGDVYGNKLQGNIEGSGINISNVQYNKIIGYLNVENGGLGCNIAKGNIVIGNNDKPVISPYLLWNNNTLYSDNYFIRDGIQGNIYGSGINISNIIASNIIDVLDISKGGIGLNNRKYEILFGGDINQNELFKYHSNLITKNIYTYDIFNSNLYTNSLSTYLQSKLIGDGYNVSNLYTSNFDANILQTGGTGYNIIPEGLILLDTVSQDLIWSNNTIHSTNLITSKIYANNYYGNAINISNIPLKYFIEELDTVYGGLNCNLIPYGNIIVGNGIEAIITSSNLLFINNSLKVKNQIHSSNYIGDRFYVSNYIDNNNTIQNLNTISSNIIGIIPYSSGGLNSNSIENAIYFSSNNYIINENKLKWENNILDISGIINATKMKADYVASNVIGTLDVLNGGIGCNTILQNSILIGNEDSIATPISLIWNNNELTTVNITTNKLFGSLSGDAFNITNIQGSNLYNHVLIANGGIGSNYLDKGTILTGNNTDYVGNPNVKWLNKVLSINGSLDIENSITSRFIGDGYELSNIRAECNIFKVNDMFNGFTNKTSFGSGNILYGNFTYNLGENIDLNWDDTNKLFTVNGGSIYANTLYAGVIFSFVGSNIVGVLNTSNGGTGLGQVPQYSVMVGNENNDIIANDNLIWIDDSCNLVIKGDIKNDIEKNIHGRYIGDGTNVLNILSSNFHGEVYAFNGGLGNNYFVSNYILFGNDYSNILYDSNLILENGFDIFTNRLVSKNIAGSLIFGDGFNISNYNSEYVIGEIKISQGGTLCNLIPSKRIVIGNDTEYILTTDDLTWDEENDELKIIGHTYATNKYHVNNYIGNGINISNIQYSNIVGELYVANGGITCNLLPYFNLLIGNGDNSIVTTSNLLFNNKDLYIYDILNVSNIYNIFTESKDLQGAFIGNGLKTSNYVDSNFIYHTIVKNGGIGHNFVGNGWLFAGNNSNSLITTNDVRFVDESFIVPNIITNNDIFTHRYYGDGQNISNYIFYVSNMIESDIIRVQNGAMGSNYYGLNELIFGDNFDPFRTSCNLYWYEGNLYVKDILACTNLIIDGNITGISYQGSFYGDGIELSNIISSNLIDAVQVKNQGTGYSNAINKGQLLVGNDTVQIITTSNLLFDVDTTTLNVKGIFEGTTFSISALTTSSNLICSNIIIAEESLYHTLYGNEIINSGEYIGLGTDLSNVYVININNLTLQVENGGLNCNLIPKNNILIGDNNRIYETSDFNWNNNRLTINGGCLYGYNLHIDNLYNNLTFTETLVGNGFNISNISLAYIIDVVDVEFGGTGCNYITPQHLLIGNNSNSIYTTSNLYWDNDNLGFHINSILNTITISTPTMSVSNILTSNNTIINNSSYHSNIYSDVLQSAYIGDGIDLSNILVSNLSKISLSVSLGGLGCNIIKEGSILIGNDEEPIILTNYLNWNNGISVEGDIDCDSLNISKLSLDNLYISSNLVGDGYNISNVSINNLIDVLPVIFGGTGSNHIDKGLLLIGNDDNAVITTSNLYRNYDTNELFIYNNFNFITLSGIDVYTSNVSVKSKLETTKIINEKIYGDRFQGSFIGSGIGLSNIYIENFDELTMRLENGGTESNIFDKGLILVGNDDKPFIITSNLMFNNNILTTGNKIYLDDIINSTSLYADNIQGLYLGDASELSNIDTDNLISVLLLTENGGTGYTSLPYDCILHSDTNSELTFTSNLRWNNNNGTLYINNTLHGNILSSLLIDTKDSISCNINIEGFSYTSNVFAKDIFANNIIGDGLKLSNIDISDIISIVKTQYGGTSCNIIPINNILIGNDNNSISTLTDVKWNNGLEINGSIKTSNIEITNIVANEVFNSTYYGDGLNISNMYLNNFKGTFQPIVSGTGLTNITKGYILVGNDIEPILTTSNLRWDTATNTLYVFEKFITKTTLSSSLIETSNLYTNNAIIDSSLDISYIKDIISTHVQGGLYGSGNNLSNVNIEKISDKLIFIQGGTDCNIIPNGNLLIGAQDSIATYDDVKWLNNNLDVKGDLYISNIDLNQIYNENYKNIYSYNLLGNGLNISNLKSDNFIGVFPVSVGGTGSNYIAKGQVLIGNDDEPGILTTPKLYFNTTTLSLHVNGTTHSLINLLNTGSLTTNDLIVSNLITTNGSIFNNIKTNDYIQGSLIGDGIAISNLSIETNFSKEVKGSLDVIKGGTGSNYLYGKTLLIGNDVNDILLTSNLIWNEDNLYILGSLEAINLDVSRINANSIYSFGISGDGRNISNININNILGQFTPNLGGLGLSNITKEYVLVGNNDDPVRISEKLYWDIDNSIFHSDERIQGTTISSALYTASNFITCNLNVSDDVSIFNHLYSPDIQTHLIGDGIGLSNIHIDALIKSGDEYFSITSNNIPFGNIIIGAGKNNIYETSNLSWYNNILYTSNIITNNLLHYNDYNDNNIIKNTSNILIYQKYNINTPFYVSLYISSSSVINNYVSFIVDNTKSTANIEPYYWNTNHFIVPNDGIYILDYSLCIDTTGYMWINKTSSLINNYKNRFGLRYIDRGGSIQQIINCQKNEIWYFALSGTGNILVNDDLNGNTKANILLIQSIS